MNERAPNRLGKSGSKMWKSIVAVYTLRPDELRVLEDCCREADTIDELQAVIDDQGFMSVGSMGQKVVHPAVQEIRQHRNVLKQMLGTLKLPDAQPSPPKSESDKARAVAHARWKRTGKA